MASMRKKQTRYWYPYVGIHDPCEPMRVKSYIVAPNQYIRFQPPGQPQYPVGEALYRGTLWPMFYGPYPEEERPS
jgi:spore coat protein JA